MIRSPRLRTLTIPLLASVTTAAVFAGPAHADTIDPIGVGDLWPSPAVTVGEGKGTMVETYAPDTHLWSLDTDYGEFDVLDPLVHIIADLLMMFLVVIGSACTTLMSWCFGLVELPGIQEALKQSISGASGAVIATIFPAALAVGAFVAFTKRTAGLSDLAWVAVSGVVALTLIQSPQTWVDGVDTGRTVGADIALSATAGGLGGDGIEAQPFKLDHKPTYPGPARDDMLRTSGDAVWRTYVATPWCVANFGSLEACRKYARPTLDLGKDKEERKTYLQDNVTEEEVGEESVQWRGGHRPMGRIGVLFPATVVALLFACLLLSLLFASIAALLGASVLLVVGAVFASLWVIPGRPRQWGTRWFDQLVGVTLQSTIVTLTAGCVMITQTATTSMMGQYGWGPSAALSIVAALAAFRYRAMFQAIVGGGGTTSALGGALGVMATRRGMRRGGALAAAAAAHGAGTAGSRGEGTDQTGGGGRGASGGPVPGPRRPAPPAPAGQSSTPAPRPAAAPPGVPGPAGSDTTDGRSPAPATPMPAPGAGPAPAASEDDPTPPASLPAPGPRRAPHHRPAAPTGPAGNAGETPAPTAPDGVVPAPADPAPAAPLSSPPAAPRRRTQPPPPSPRPTTPRTAPPSRAPRYVQPPLPDPR